MSWLECDTTCSGTRKNVVKLRCKVCKKFEDKIVGRRNYSDKWLKGADSVRTSNIKDHSQSDQHEHAMLLLRKEQAIASGLGPSSYAPIVKMLCELSEDTKQMLRIKFDIAYFVATQRLAFIKYPALCDLESKHGVNLGTSYRMKMQERLFVTSLLTLSGKLYEKIYPRPSFFCSYGWNYRQG